MKKKKGFTLIELVIVVAIILVLISIALPKYNKAKLNAQAAAHNANVKEIKNAAMLYLMDNPDETSVTMDNLSDYFDSEPPSPAKALNIKSFSLSIDDSSSISVTPGNVKVEGSTLVVEGD